VGEIMNVGIIGTGGIAPAYVRGCRYFDRALNVVACADLDHERAAAFAAEWGIRAVTTDQLLADPDIQIVINLTVPKAHAEVSLAAIAAGKHVYSEKPLGIAVRQGRQILDAAHDKGVRVGCAPDTFLGGGLQTCRKLIDDGWIGEPVGATAFMLGRGPESWHLNPHFFYELGGGPLFDMGPYYLTALVHLLGPVKRLSGSARITFPERIATSQKWYGERLPVEVPTHVSATLEFAGGPVATAILSFDVWAHTLPRIEIYGSEGTLLVPDPNTFGGPVKLWTSKDHTWQRRDEGSREGDWRHAGWREVPLSHSPQVSRGVGVADMAYAIRSGRPHRASGALAFHVLDIMESIYTASKSGHYVALDSQCSQPGPLPVGLLEHTLDD